MKIAAQNNQVESYQPLMQPIANAPQDVMATFKTRTEQQVRVIEAGLEHEGFRYNKVLLPPTTKFKVRCPVTDADNMSDILAGLHQGAEQALQLSGQPAEAACQILENTRIRRMLERLPQSTRQISRALCRRGQPLSHDMLHKLAELRATCEMILKFTNSRTDTSTSDAYRKAQAGIDDLIDAFDPHVRAMLLEDVRLLKNIGTTGVAPQQESRPSPYCASGDYFLGLCALKIPELSDIAKAYLRANDALFELALNGYKAVSCNPVQSDWCTDGYRRPSADDLRKALPEGLPGYHTPKGKIAKKAMEDAGLGNAPIRGYALLQLYNQARLVFFNHPLVRDIASYWPEMMDKLPAYTEPRVKTVCVDPLNIRLPVNLLKYIDSDLQEIQVDPSPAWQALQQRLRVLRQKTEAFLHESRAENVLALEVYYLFEHEVSLTSLNQEFATIAAERRTTERTAMAMSARLSEPQAPVKLNKKARQRARSALAQASLPATPATANASPAATMQPAPAETVVLNPVEADPEAAPSSSRQLVKVNGHLIHSHLSKHALSSFLAENYCQAGFASLGDSLARQMQKHVPPQQTVEEWLRNSQKVFADNNSQKGTPSSWDPRKLVKVIRSPKFFGVYDWDSHRTITFCQKDSCPTEAALKAK